MMISYGCVYKRSSKPVMESSRVETVEAAREEYKKLLEEGEGWKKTSILHSYLNLAATSSICLLSVEVNPGVLLAYMRSTW